MTTDVNRSGYITCRVTKGTLRIHKLVAEHFIGVPPRDCVVDHIDEDKTNNVVTNLRYLLKNINVRPRKYKEPLFGKTSKRYKGKIEVYDLITGEVLITLRGSAEMRKEGRLRP